MSVLLPFIHYSLPYRGRQQPGYSMAFSYYYARENRWRMLHGTVKINHYAWWPRLPRYRNRQGYRTETAHPGGGNIILHQLDDCQARAYLYHLNGEPMDEGNYQPMDLDYLLSIILKSLPLDGALRAHERNEDMFRSFIFFRNNIEAATTQTQGFILCNPTSEQITYRVITVRGGFVKPQLQLGGLTEGVLMPEGTVALTVQCPPFDNTSRVNCELPGRVGRKGRNTAQRKLH